MTENNTAVDIFHDGNMLKLAREIAMDVQDLDKILDLHKVTNAEWEVMKNSPHFKKLLTSELEVWESALNTSERVKIKSMAFIEESLPELYARAHDPKETLSSKVELIKAITKLAGLDKTTMDGTVGERLIVNISMGADHKLKIEKDVTKTIEGSLST